MCVLGGVFVDKAIIQPLTDYIWLGGDPFDSTRQVFVARLFTALKSAIKSLEKYYQALALGLPCSNVRRLPLITEYGPDQTKFTYSSRLAPENKYRLLYPAALDDVPNSPMIVKFVQRYNADAHRLLAAQGLAPKLHYSSTDDNVRYGKRFMIVMDYIDLKPPLGRLTEQQCKRVKDAIDILYSNQLVFGDLRRPNILVGNDTAMLVDFDWCGKSGEARYPPEINRDPSMGWPQMWDQIALLSRLFRIPKPPLK